VSGRTTRALLIPVVTVATLLAGGLAASTAHAQPTPQEIEAQIDRAWRELAPIVEQHNVIWEELAEKKAQAKKLAEEIAPLQLKVDKAIAEVSDLAIHAYTTGDTSAFNALLTSGSPYTFAEQLTVLDQFAKLRQQQISKVVKAKEKYEERKAELDSLIEELSAMEAELAKKAEEIDAEIDRLQALRIQAYGTSGGTGELRPAACPAEYYGDAGSEAASFACAQVGKPYAWGASGPNAYDCSGLTSAAWAQAGVSLPHNAAQQRNVTRYIDRSELRPGDLVFYYGDLSHVAIYVGGGYIVDAPQPGVPVKMRSMDGPGPIHSYGRP